MKATLIYEICQQMNSHLTAAQAKQLERTLQRVFRQFNIPDYSEQITDQDQHANARLLNLFLAAKKIEGCSENTIKYYSATLLNMINFIQKKNL